MTGRGRVLALTIFVAFAFTSPLGGRVVERACAASNIRIAVVVDIGTGPSVSAVCVPARATDNGATILAARTSMLGVPPPHYAPSGLLCSIDGVPATCSSAPSGGQFAYWSYWHGSGGKWSYANVGPAGSRVDPGVVEGWRYQPNGSGNATDLPPRGPADPAKVCAPVAPQTTAPPPTAGTAPPVTGATTPAPGAGGSRSTTTSSSPGGLAVVPSTAPTKSTPTTRRPATAPGRAPNGATGSSSSSIALTNRGIAAASTPRDSGGGSVGVGAGIALIVVLGAGGAIAARRRRRAAS